MDNCVTPNSCDTPSTIQDVTGYELPDIHLALVEKRADLVNGFIVDKETGEILGEYAQASASHTLSRPRPHKAPDECLSVDDWHNYRDQHVDRRELPSHTKSALLDAQDAALGERFRNGEDYRISRPMMALLLKLHEIALYRNVIVMTQTDLSKHLEVNESNLSAKLAKLVEAGLLRVFTSRTGNMRKGEIKLLINPRLVFRGNDYLQGNAIETWYRHQTVEAGHQIQHDSQFVMHDHRVRPVQIAA